MITLSVLTYIIWTVARFKNRRYDRWTADQYEQYGAWYAILWDMVHMIAIIVGVVYVCLKCFK